MMTTIAIEGTNKKVQDFLKAIEGFANLAGVTITVGDGVSEEPKAETKKASASKPKTSKSKKNAKVLRVDKYGNQWIAEYVESEYREKKREMISNKTYKDHASVYKELGWIL